MALTAKLYADFGNFYDAVQQAEVSLKSFETGSQKVEAQLNRMVDQFSGRKLVQDATLMVEAIERIGGAGKLTQDELERVGAKAGEAADKLRAMGQDVPTKIQAMADAAKDAREQTGFWGDALTTLAGTFGALSLQRIIDEVIQLGKEVFDNAEHLKLLKDRTDISVETLQRLQKVGKDTGVDLDTMANAMNTLQQKLGEGSGATAHALDNLGLSLADIKKLDPEDQFFQVAAALKAMKDPTDQAANGAELLGKAYKDMRPAIKKGFDETKDAAEAWSRSTVEALAGTKQAVTDTVDVIKGGFGQVVADVLTGTTEGFRRLKDEVEKLPKVAVTFPDMWGAILPPSVPKDLDTIIQKSDDWAKTAKTQADALADIADLSKDWAGTLKDLNPATVDLANNAIAHGAAQKTVVDAYGLTKGAVKELADQQKLWADFEKTSHDLFIKHTNEEADAKKTQTKTMNDTVIAGMTQTKKAQDDLNDMIAKSTLSSTDYQLLKIKEAADAEIAAFKGTADQKVKYSEIVMAQAKRESDAIITAAANALDVVVKKGQDALTVLQIAANQAQRGMAVDVVGNREAAGIPSSGMQTPIYATPMGAYGRPVGAPVASGQPGQPSSLYADKIFGRAAGGPVSIGQPYWVGERGPELFVPKGNGSIVPTGGAGGAVVNVYVTQPLGTASQIADAVGKAVMQNLRQQGVRTPSSV